MSDHLMYVLYIFIDDFCKWLFKSKFGEQAEKYWFSKRGPERNLSLSEVMTLNVIRFLIRIQDLKTFHKEAVFALRSYFPKMPNYENFLKATNKSGVFVWIFLKYLLFLQRDYKENEHFMDSTDLPVCKNYNIYSHKVTAGISARGKTTKGWFYGLKLHGVCNREGKFENLLFTAGDVHDNICAYQVIDGLKGIFTCDAGYLLKEEDLERFFAEEKIMYTATRKNMKRLMTDEQKQLFRARSIIETAWDVMKERFELVFNLARSIHGLFRHYFYSLFSCLLSRTINIGRFISFCANH